MRTSDVAEDEVEVGTREVEQSDLREKIEYITLQDQYDNNIDVSKYPYYKPILKVIRDENTSSNHKGQNYDHTHTTTTPGKHKNTSSASNSKNKRRKLSSAATSALFNGDDGDNEAAELDTSAIITNHKTEAVDAANDDDNNDEHGNNNSNENNNVIRLELVDDVYKVCLLQPASTFKLGSNSTNDNNILRLELTTDLTYYNNHTHTTTVTTTTTSSKSSRRSTTKLTNTNSSTNSIHSIQADIAQFPIIAGPPAVILFTSPESLTYHTHYTTTPTTSTSSNSNHNGSSSSNSNSNSIRINKYQKVELIFELVDSMNRQANVKAYKEVEYMLCISHTTNNTTTSNAHNNNSINTNNNMAVVEEEENVGQNGKGQNYDPSLILCNDVVKSVSKNMFKLNKYIDFEILIAYNTKNNIHTSTNNNNNNVYKLQLHVICYNKNNNILPISVYSAPFDCYIEYSNVVHTLSLSLLPSDAVTITDNNNNDNNTSSNSSGNSNNNVQVEVSPHATPVPLLPTTVVNRENSSSSFFPTDDTAPISRPCEEGMPVLMLSLLTEDGHNYMPGMGEVEECIQVKITLSRDVPVEAAEGGGDVTAGKPHEYMIFILHEMLHNSVKYNTYTILITLIYAYSTNISYTTILTLILGEPLTQNLPDFYSHIYHCRTKQALIYTPNNKYTYMSGVYTITILYTETRPEYSYIHKKYSKIMNTYKYHMLPGVFSHMKLLNSERITNKAVSNHTTNIIANNVYIYFHDIYNNITTIYTPYTITCTIQRQQYNTYNNYNDNNNTTNTSLFASTDDLPTLLNTDINTDDNTNNDSNSIHGQILQNKQGVYYPTIQIREGSGSIDGTLFLTFTLTNNDYIHTTHTSATPIIMTQNSINTTTSQRYDIYEANTYISIPFKFMTNQTQLQAINRYRDELHAVRVSWSGYVYNMLISCVLPYVYVLILIIQYIMYPALYYIHSILCTFDILC